VAGGALLAGVFAALFLPLTGDALEFLALTGTGDAFLALAGDAFDFLAGDAFLAGVFAARFFCVRVRVKARVIVGCVIIRAWVGVLALVAFLSSFTQ
jgi:hypothetical protein